MTSITTKALPISKRIFDIIVALIGLIILSPLMLLITLIILIFSGTPVLFRQVRPGYKGRLFTIYKFCTMHHTSDAQGSLLPDDQRLTRLGRFLRSNSLDELPELINVLKGEMSWVGPRPLLVAYLDLYNAEQARRHDVLPGITGWAQVNGRNAITWEEKFALDVWYVDNWSFWLDIKILFMTIRKVIKHEGISQPGQATAEPFRGNAIDSQED